MTDHWGFQALICATAQRDFELAELFLERGIGVDAQNLAGDRPLAKAVERGCKEGIAFLLKHRANLEAACDRTGRTVLMVAASVENLDVLTVLVERRANLEATDRRGQTALMAAVERENSRLYGELPDAVGDPRLDKWALVCFLLEQGADLEKRDIEGETPLMRAVGVENMELASFLIRRGADVNAQDASGRTLLMRSVEPASLRAQPESGLIDLELVRFLISQRADLEVLGPCGMTALMLSTESGNLHLVQFLLQAGANANATDHHGGSASAIANLLGLTQVVRLLLAWRADHIAMLCTADAGGKGDDCGDTSTREPSSVDDVASRASISTGDEA